MLNNASKSSVSSTNMAQRLLVMPLMSVAESCIAGNSAPSRRRPGSPDCQTLRPQASATATAPMLAKEIRQLREQFPNLGKDKLQVLLRPWCRQQDIALPSVSAIGRIIARDPDKMRHAPIRLSTRGRHKPIPCKRKTRKPKGFKHQPLEVFVGDTVVRLRDGLRRCLFTFIDPHSRFAIAFAAQSSQLPSPLTRCVNGCQNRRASGSKTTARSSWDASSNALTCTASPTGGLSPLAHHFAGREMARSPRSGFVSGRIRTKRPPAPSASTAPSKSSSSIITRMNCSMTWPALTANWPTGYSTATPSCPIIASACNLLQLPHP